LKTKNGFEWCWDYELEYIDNNSQQPTEEEKPKPQKKTDLRYLG
jgi:hypothetical protein